MTERQAAEEQAAKEYAALILDGPDRDWRAINAAIVDRWSMTALRRVKERAWAIVAERREAIR